MQNENNATCSQRDSMSNKKSPIHSQRLCAGNTYGLAIMHGSVVENVKAGARASVTACAETPRSGPALVKYNTSATYAYIMSMTAMRCKCVNNGKTGSYTQRGVSQLSVVCYTEKAQRCVVLALAMTRHHNTTRPPHYHLVTSPHQGALVSFCTDCELIMPIDEHSGGYTACCSFTPIHHRRSICDTFISALC